MGGFYVVFEPINECVHCQAGNLLSGATMSSSFDPRITAYFGDAVLQAGFVPLPHLFLRHYRDLGLSHIQAMFTIQLMEIAWDVSSPPTSVAKLAARMGVGHRTIQVCSKEMHTLGLIEIYDQFDKDGAQVENGYDLSPLFRRLAELAPAQRPPGEIRARRARARGIDEDASAPQRAPTATSTLPVQDSAPAPRKDMHRPGESTSTGGMHEVAGLKEESKNRIKKQTKTTQQQIAAVVGTQVNGLAEHSDREAERGGSSLRWNTPLTPDDVIQSQDVLRRIGLNAAVVDTAGPTLHPAESWALWCYARAAGLGTAWIASQIYDARQKRARPASLPSRYDAVGHVLAPLPATIAEAILASVDGHCLDGIEHCWNLIRTDPGLLDAEGGDATCLHPPVRAALNALFAMMTDLRRGRVPVQGSTRLSTEQVSIPVLSASPSQLDDPWWTAARANVAKHATPTEFNTWIEPLVVLDVIGETIILGAPNVFVRDEVAKAYLSSITDALATEFGRAMQVEVVIGTVRTA